jgi:hypothetical protein
VNVGIIANASAIALVLRSRRDEWIIAYPVASISPRINKVDVTVREILDSAFRQNFDEISPGI